MVNSIGFLSSQWLLKNLVKGKTMYRKFDNSCVRHLKSKGFKYNKKCFRFYLEIETNAVTNDIAIVVMKNPAKACIQNLCINRCLTSQDSIESDSTVNNVIKLLKNQYKKIIILNLYPFMHSDTNEVKKIYHCKRPVIKQLISRTSRRNAFTIKNTLKANINAKIFCAWGQESNLVLSEYSKIVYKFVRYCFRHHIVLGEFSATNNMLWNPLSSFLPAHGSQWK